MAQWAFKLDAFLAFNGVQRTLRFEEVWANDREENSVKFCVS